MGNREYEGIRIMFDHASEALGHEIVEIQKEGMKKIIQETVQNL